MVVWSGFNDPGNFAFVDSRRVKPGSGALLGNTVRLAVTGGTYITDVTYNSATNQWFFNLANNAANLDNQNGGFTVFGKVVQLTAPETARPFIGIENRNPVSWIAGNDALF